jgi:hypothetical protein
MHHTAASGPHAEEVDNALREFVAEDHAHQHEPAMMTA